MEFSRFAVVRRGGFSVEFATQHATGSGICTTKLRGRHSVVSTVEGVVPWCCRGEIPLWWNFGDNTLMETMQRHNTQTTCDNMSITFSKVKDILDCGFHQL